MNSGWETPYVELSSTDSSSLVQSDDFNTEEVVSGRNALGHVEVPPTSVINEVIDGPGTAVETLVSDLEPLQAARAS